MTGHATNGVENLLGLVMDSTPTTHASVLLERDVNVVEFCPQEGLTHLLAAGTYTLHEKGGNRDGTVHLFNVRQDKVLDPCEELDERYVPIYNFWCFSCAPLRWSQHHLEGICQERDG